MQNLKISNTPEKDLIVVEDFILKKSPGDPVKKSISLTDEFRIGKQSLLKKKTGDMSTGDMLTAIAFSSMSPEKWKSLESI